MSNVYGMGVDEPIIRFTSTNVYYFYPDHEGSITHVANGNSLAEQYRYDAFGAPTIRNGSGTILSASAIGNRFMFTGREYKSDFGVYEYRNRAYHPGLGRFMSEDPKGFDAGDYNLYRYCHNDPVNKTDPFGLDAILRLDGVYLGNAVVASEFAGGSERGNMPSAYSPRGQTIQVNADRSEAALPARLSTAERAIEVANPANAKQTSSQVTDVGPHNTRDRYWDSGARPLAERQFADKTPAQNGKVPTNPAGIDLTPKAMKDLGVKGPENTRQAPVIWWKKDEPFSGYKPFFNRGR